MKSPFFQSAEKITKELQEKEVYAYTFEDLSRQFSNEVDWLWRNHIPKGEPIIINGQEGCGKTTICLQISKEILDETQEGIIVWLPTEGAVQSTLKQMAKLGLTSARFVTPKKADGSFKWDFRLKNERKIFQAFLDEVSKKQSILAVFIDSLSGAMTTDENSKETGMVMQQINAIVCDKHKATLVWIHHLSRRKEGSLLERNRGHSSISASVRLILTVVRVSKFKRKILEAKNNLTDILPELEVVKFKNRLVIYEPVKGVAEETVLHRAEKLLTDLFAERDKIPAREIYSKGEDLGISASTLRTVKGQLGIDDCRIGGKSYWVWSLPKGVGEIFDSSDSKNGDFLKLACNKGFGTQELSKKNCQGTVKGETVRTVTSVRTVGGVKEENGSDSSSDSSSTKGFREINPLSSIEKDNSLLEVKNEERGEIIWK